MFNPPLQISYSSLALFNTCERKYQLTKLLENVKPKKESAYFSRGHSFGALVQTYLLTGDEDLALFNAWLAYYPKLELPEKNITESLTLGLLFKLKGELDLIRLEWEVATFNGKPAVELSFRLLIGEDFIYVGFVDIVLRNKITGMYAVFEIKTTTNNSLDVVPLYKNSDQAVIYSAVLDHIAGKELTKYQVVYLVMQDVFGKSTFHVLTFQKTLLDRLNAFFSIGLDIKRIEMCEQLGVYPMRGSKCMAYKQVCPHFGTCHLQGADRPAKREPNEEEFQFTFHLEEVIEDHLRRIHG